MSVDAVFVAKNDIDFLNRNAFKSDEALQKDNQIDGVITRLASHLKPNELSPKEFMGIPIRFKESIFKKYKELHEADQKNGTNNDDDALISYLDDELAKALLPTHLFDKVINKNYLNYNANFSTLAIHSSYLTEDEFKNMLANVDQKLKSNIVELDLSNCPITDLTGIDDFTNVTKLILTSNTELKSLAGIEKFPNLTTLVITNCGGITSLKGIEGLPLKEITADASGLEDIGELYQCADTLTSLNLSGCSFLDEGYAKVISQLNNLESLELCHHKKLHDTNFAHDLIGLKTLNLDYSNVANLDGIAHLAGLKAPKCQGCPLPKSEFAKLTKIATA